MTRNQNQNQKKTKDLNEYSIMDIIRENKKDIEIENFDLNEIIVLKPYKYKKPVNYIAYQVLARRIRMKAKMKINRFSCDNFSLSISISESQQEMLHKIEKRIQVETLKQDSELKKINSKAKIIPENLILVKDSFSGPKLYGKIYAKDDYTAIHFYQKENDKKREIENPLAITSEFTGEVVFDITRVFLGEKESIICAIEGVLIDEIEEASYFNELETIVDSYE